MGQRLAVVVTGGTGTQGGAVVKTLLERSQGSRGHTHPTSPFHDFESWAKAQDWNTLLQGA
jgi:uncharacterized protein YbjT (DUF2867 family)